MASYGVDIERLLVSGAGADAWRSAFAEALPPAHLAFFKSSRAQHYRFGDYLFVHAGLRPGVPLAAQGEADIIWIRSPFLDHAGSFGKVVVHGHTPRRRAGHAAEPYRHRYRRLFHRAADGSSPRGEREALPANISLRSDQVLGCSATRPRRRSRKLPPLLCLPVRRLSLRAAKRCAIEAAARRLRSRRRRERPRSAPPCPPAAQPSRIPRQQSRLASQARPSRPRECDRRRFRRRSSRNAGHFRLCGLFSRFETTELRKGLRDFHHHALLRHHRSLGARRGKDVLGEPRHLAAQKGIFLGARPRALELLLRPRQLGVQALAFVDGACCIDLARAAHAAGFERHAQALDIGALAMQGAARGLERL